MRHIRHIVLLLSCWTLGFCAIARAADEGQQRVTPAIEGYGAVVPLPDAAVQLDPAKEYRLVFDITRRGEDDGSPLAGLETAARFINLAALAGVPQEHVHIVMAIHGAGTSHALSSTRYMERYGTDNPSLDLINKLTSYGVEVYVCGQALAGAGFAHAEVHDEITIAVAALTVLANYQLAGYALMSY